MPYIITTRPKTDDVGDGIPGWDDAQASRRAVATLDEALGPLNAVLRVADDEAYAILARQVDCMPEQGGTVGPLPDGTVIEVERVLLDDLSRALRDVRVPAGQELVIGQTQIIDAYNAAQR